MPIYRRHLRHGNFDRVRHSVNFLDFLAEQAARLSGTGTGATVTFDNTTNQVTLVGHGYVSGQGPFLLSNSGGALPAELDGATDYWVNVVDTDNFTLHLTEADAEAGTNVVAFTDNGTGTHTILVAAEMVDIYLAMKQGKSAEQVRGVTNIDNL